MWSKMYGSSGSVRPVIRYRDPASAIRWLEAAFGFECRHVAQDDNGQISYAELVSGDNLITIGPIGNGWLDSMKREPDERLGAETQICSLVVKDVAESYAKVLAAHLEIVVELSEDDAIGENFSCRDPEGRIWHVAASAPHTSNQLFSRTALNRFARLVEERIPIRGGLITLVGVGVVGLILASFFINYEPDVDIKQYATVHDGKRMFRGSQIQKPGEEKRLEHSVAETNEQKIAVERNGMQTHEEAGLQPDGVVNKELDDLLKAKTKKLAEIDASQKVIQRSLEALQAEISREKEARRIAERDQKKVYQKLATERGEKKKLQDVIETLKTGQAEKEKVADARSPTPRTPTQRQPKDAKVSHKTPQAEARTKEKLSKSAVLRQKKVGEKNSKKTDAAKNNASTATAAQLGILQRELIRVGCLSGNVSGRWDERSKRAFNEFIQKSDRGYPKKVKARVVISALRATRTKVCQ